VIQDAGGLRLRHQFDVEAALAWVEALRGF
jgi:hypothetical protein